MSFIKDLRALGRVGVVTWGIHSLIFLIFQIHPISSGFACLRNPCLHGICIDEINSTHQCFCIDGFTGYSCQINWDECNVKPCLNGGICIDGIASFNCSCPENFAGTTCEYDLSECVNYFPCENNGTCRFDPELITTGKNGSGFYCACPNGFSGALCEEDISICNSTQNICLHGGECVDGIGDKFYCQCAPGWIGRNCGEEINECISEPCQNGGVCIDLVNEFSCACPFGFTGKICESKLQICPVNPCKNNGFCLEENGLPKCYCFPDFHGKLCEDKYNECEPEPKCFNGGTCIDGVGGFTCSCPPEFFGPLCQCTEYNATDPACQVPPLGNETISDTYPPIWTSTITMVYPTPTPITITATPVDQTEGLSPTQSDNPEITPTDDFEITPTPTLFTTILTTSLDFESTMEVLPSESKSDELSTFHFPSPTLSDTLIVEDTETQEYMPTPSITPTVTDVWTPTPEPSESESSDTFPSSPTMILPTASPTPPEETSLVTPGETISTSTASVEFETVTFTPTPPVEPEPSATVTGPWEVTPPLWDNETETTTQEQITSESDNTTIIFTTEPGTNVSTTPVSHENGTSRTDGSTEVPQSSLPTSFTTEMEEPSTANSTVTQDGRAEGTDGTTSDQGVSEVSTGTTAYALTSEEPSTLGEESRSTVSEESRSTVSEESRSTVSEDPRSTVSEAPRSTVSEDPRSTGSEESRSTVSEEPRSTVSEEPRSTVSEEPHSTISEEPRPTISEEPRSTVSEEPRPTVSEEPHSTVSEEPRFTISETSPAVTSKEPRTTVSRENEITLVTSEVPRSTASEVSSDTLPTVTTEVAQMPVSAVTSVKPLTTVEDKVTPIIVSEEPTTSSTAASEISTLRFSERPPSNDVTTVTITTESDFISTFRPTPDQQMPQVTLTTTDGTSDDYLNATNSASTTVTYELTTSPANESSTEDPCLNYCQNSAKCVLTTLEPVCICNFKFHGQRCELDSEKVLVPALRGNSFLRYNFPAESSRTVVDVSLQMATVVPEGVVMYTSSNSTPTPTVEHANSSDNVPSYALIFIQNGHLVLHFSCGSQSMEFVEKRTRVNNGYNFTLDLAIGVHVQVHGNRSDIYCVGKLSVNGSAYVMSGEQRVGREFSAFEDVYVGGVESKVASHVNSDVIAFVPGFRGCLYRVSINQESRDMYDEAMDGKEIVECETFSCVINPCFGSSKCIPASSPPFWECICPTGFKGPRCQIKVCLENPCKNGAICSESRPLGNKTSTNSSHVTCLCPLGFSGSVCQSRISITKPSFHPTEDFASFISYYALPRLDDWFQMKFHFVTSNFSQIALLAFIGNQIIQSPQLHRLEDRQIESPLAVPMAAENETHNSSISTNPEQPDFFALSFLQGFLAMTWNLGSGTQRIVTPSKVDHRLQVHTIYFGRSGRQGWVKVDGMRNVTGRSPGPMFRLNVDEELYVGGFESYRHEGLPHDFPLHAGFQGCVFDLGMRLKNKLFLPKPFKGRNVKNCFEDC